MRFQFVLVGAMLIGAPWLASAAERNNRPTAYRTLRPASGGFLAPPRRAVKYHRLASKL